MVIESQLIHFVISFASQDMQIELIAQDIHFEGLLMSYVVDDGHTHYKFEDKTPYKGSHDKHRTGLLGSHVAQFDGGSHREQSDPF